MRRDVFGLLLAAAGSMAAIPSGVEAQVQVQVGLYWEFGDDGWRSYRPREVYYDDGYGYEYGRPREVVYYTPRRRIKVPPGHMPRPGYCRPWYPGVPPGHQPRAQPCELLFRTNRYPGAVIIGAPTYDDVVIVGRDFDDRRPGRGRGRGRR